MVLRGGRSTTYGREIPFYTTSSIRHEKRPQFGVSSTHAAAVYNIASPSTITNWLKQLDECGVDALETKKRDVHVRQGLALKIYMTNIPILKRKISTPRLVEW